MLIVSFAPDPEQIADSYITYITGLCFIPGKYESSYMYYYAEQERMISCALVQSHVCSVLL